MSAFDPVARIWVPREHPGAVGIPQLRGALRYDEASVRWAAEDFGHLVHHRPRAVLRPGSVADVAAIVAFAAEAGLPVAARGAGHSTYGQAQAAGGVVIDMAALNQVGDVRGGQVTVQAGALWSEVLDATLAQGCTPPVLTDYLHTTIGGTLAVGGVGGATQHHGLQVDGVAELEVVTGAGRLVTCSPQRNRELFDAVRAGLGQCGVITSATLRVVPTPARARCYRLHYQDLATYLADQHLLVAQGRFDYLEGQVLPGESGGWRYLLEAATYYRPPATPHVAMLLDGLSQDREEEDFTYRDFQHRLAPGEAALRATGEWLHPHAWLNVLLPADTAAHVVGAILAELSAADLGSSGLAMLYPVRTGLLHAPLTRVPDSDLVWLFALLRTAGADDPAVAAAMTESNRASYDLAVTYGGVAYPVNSLPMSPDDWRTHFGPRWPQLRTAKEEFDPHRILTPGQGIAVDVQR
ncbi:MAG: FAD-binding protein [Pseudonocardiaceae bacterium]